MTRAVALTLITELRAAGRITTVERDALNQGLAIAQTAADAEHWLLPRAFDPEAMRTWMRRVCVEIEMSPTSLAPIAGIQPSTLTRFLAREDETNIGASTINAIVLACRERLASPAQPRRRAHTFETPLPIADLMGYVRREIFMATQVEFAATAGVSQGTVSRWESGEFEPTRHQLAWIRSEALARGLSWDDAWFFEPSTPAPLPEPDAITSVGDLFGRFDGSAALGRAIGKGQSTASEMKRRGSIPIEHWPALIAAARDIGLELDEALLVKIHLTSPAEERAP